MRRRGHPLWMQRESALTCLRWCCAGGPWGITALYLEGAGGILPACPIQPPGQAGQRSQVIFPDILSLGVTTFGFES